MRWFALILICAVLSKISAEPEPKKYKPENRDKGKQTNTSLTDEERQFLREVEVKFGVKPDVLAETKKPEQEKKEEQEEKTSNKTPFPAVIAIEIVNDTETKSNGKRTIDANLGYGYKTDTGYAYTYLGKSSQEKGKFMIYPYSQEDIPPARPNTYHSQKSSVHFTTSSPNVEIQPSRAFELIDVKDEQPTQQHRTPNEHRSTYDNIKGLVSPPPSYSAEQHQEQLPSSTPTTLYTTYNGEQFSGLSGQFPMVMPNYFVDPSQLLKYPQFQSAGLSQDHLRTSGSPAEQKVVPVLVLRVPSSYLKNPTAELYPNLPQNYPLSQHLNHVNLQELVNNYFKKIGFSTAPQIMAYQSPLLSNVIQTPISTPVTNYEPQHYAAPYIRPSYTQADVAGVQYSAVKPVMAKYPLAYARPQYYISTAQHTYQKPVQQYEYTYRYVPKPVEQQSYYIQPQYQTTQQVVSHQHIQNEHVALSQESSVQNAASQVEYGAPQREATNVTPVAPSVEYGPPETQSASVQASAQPAAAHYSAPNVPTQEYGVPNVPTQEYGVPNIPTQKYGVPNVPTQEYGVRNVPTQKYGVPNAPIQEYGVPNEGNVQYVTQQVPTTEYGPTKVNLPVIYTTSAEAVQALAAQYGLPRQKETYAVFPSQSGHIPRYINSHANAEAQNYYYQQVSGDSASNTITLSENYPSKDHTIATVLPVSYKHGSRPHTQTVQAVSYVTPTPYSHKYQSPYRIMVPQTVLKNSEKVSYVNSHSLPYSQNGQEQNQEAEYTVPNHFVPPVGKQKAPVYPRNYHAHPKRMVKPEPKSTNASSKKHERSEKKTT